MLSRISFYAEPVAVVLAALYVVYQLAYDVTASVKKACEATALLAEAKAVVLDEGFEVQIANDNLASYKGTLCAGAGVVGKCEDLSSLNQLIESGELVAQSDSTESELLSSYRAQVLALEPVSTWANLCAVKGPECLGTTVWFLLCMFLAYILLSNGKDGGLVEFPSTSSAQSSIRSRLKGP